MINCKSFQNDDPPNGKHGVAVLTCVHIAPEVGWLSAAHGKVEKSRVRPLGYPWS
jgi:hypothetical protein